ncbi:MAG TPA: isochorismatase family protein [Candidatus Acidoferrales bacterium]|nr:isochorismatase family protein [Candidatus Acidoferrales bacterium]
MSRFIMSLIALCVLGALTAGPASAQQMPTSPAPVAVALNPATTALIVLDVATEPCGRIPRCTALVPRVVALLAAARKAGAFVVYSSNDPKSLVAPTVQPPFLPAVAPAAGDPVVVGTAQDRFFNTQLDVTLRKKGITTVILAGWRINGSLLFTGVGAAIRNYTVVVADDATSGPADYDVAIGRYQLLTQLNGNPKNEPLLKSAVTLSRTDLITFR